MMRLFLSFFLLLLWHPLRAQTPAPAYDPAWLRLLHYEAHGDAWQSRITASAFFLNPLGPTQPEAEWQTLVAAQDPEQQTLIACRFPARVLVYQKLTGQTWPVVPCRDYQEWKRRLHFHSLSLVYSTAYAGNPASVLGHNILKLNMQEPGSEEDPESGLPLLDYGLGFLARNDPNDGPVFYVLNGLFGGYPGFFVLQPYYELVNTYAYAENRDLWEVEFTLTPAEEDLFLAHVWELTHQASTPYYFTHVNCSTMLLEILDAVRPDWNLRARMSGLVLPQAVMQTVAAAVGGAEQHFWPSQKRILTRHWNLLSRPQQDRFMEWHHSQDLMAVADDALVLDTILDQINVEKSRKEGHAQDALRAAENQVLLARARLPATDLQLPQKAEAGNNPLLAHGLHKVRYAAGTDAEGGLLALRLRWGVHDLLDAPQGFNAWYHLNFLDLNLTQRTRAASLDYDFRVVDLMSLNPWERMDPAGSWSVLLGVQKEEDGPRPYFQGAYGASWELATDRSLIYVMPSTKLTITEADAGLRVGWYHAWSGRWRQLIEVEPFRDLTENRAWKWQGQWEQRWNWSERWQLEWKLARQERWQTQVGVGQFF